MKNYVLVGDIHSQYLQLNDALNFIIKNIDNPYIIFLGDLFDSRVDYSDSVSVYSLVRTLQDKGLCTILQSNHQDKHIRYLKGHDVYLNNGLDLTIEDFKKSNIDNDEILSWLQSFPYGITFKDKDNVEYRCSHAYFSSTLLVPESYVGEYKIDLVSKKTKSKCLYGPLYDTERVEWWTKPSSNSWIRVAGHYHRVHIDLETTKSLVLDAECGSPGGKLCIYDVNLKTPYFF